MRYLLYAVGEIALVVIGILIALYVNERQQWREDRQQELMYLQGFRTDLDRNLTELERVLAKSESISNACDTLIAWHRLPAEDIPMDRFMETVGNSMGYTQHITQQGTLGDLMGSGKLDVIRNDSIRRALASWEADLKMMQGWEKEGRDSFLRLIEYMDDNIPAYEPPDPQFIRTELMQRMLFLNRVTERGFTAANIHDIYRQTRPRWPFSKVR